MDNNTEEAEIGILEQKKTEIEKIMLELDPQSTKENHSYYLAAVIDTWFYNNRISENVRGQLYELYAF